MSKPNRNFSLRCEVKLFQSKCQKWGRVCQISFNKVLVRWDDSRFAIWIPKDKVEVVRYN